MAIRHAKISGVANPGDPTLVGGEDWDDDHAWALPHVVLTHSATFSISGTTPHNFDTELADSDGFHSTVTNNSRITVPAGLGGVYWITGALSIGANNTGYREIRFLVNGTVIIHIQRQQAVQSVGHLMGASVLNLLSDGDYVELVPISSQTGLSSFVGTPSPAYAPRFSAFKIA